MGIAEDAAAFNQQPTTTNNIAADAAAFQNNTASQPDPTFGANIHLTNPMGQSLSNIPEGQSVLPDPESTSSQGVSYWEKTGGKDWKKVPDFVKNTQMIMSGAAEGSLTFASNLLSQIPGLKKPIQEANQYWADKRKEYEKQGFDTTSMDIGKFGAEMLQTGVLNKPMGKVAEWSEKAAAALPSALSKLGQYGTQALGNTALFAGLSSQQYDPNKPDQLFNTDAAYNTMTDPNMYALSALGTLFANWMKNSRALADAQAVDPNAMMRNVMDNPSAEKYFAGKSKQTVAEILANGAEPSIGSSAKRKFSDMFFGIIPSLFSAGKQFNQQEEIGSAINAFIQQVAKGSDAQNVVMNADKLTQYSANIIQSTMKKMEYTENKLWEKGFKSNPVYNPSDVKDSVINAIDLLNTNKVSGYETVVNNLNNQIRKSNLTIEDVKKLQTILSGAAINARGLYGGIGNDLANGLSEIKNTLTKNIQDSLSPKDLKDFNAASQYSAHKFDLFNNAAKLESTINDAAASHRLVTSLISEGGVLPPKQAVMNALPQGGRDMIAATKLRQALESSDTAGRINLDTFLTKTGPNSQMAGMLDPPKLKSLQGLQVYLKNVDDASKVGWWRQAAVGGTALAAMGLGGATAGATGMAIPLISYGAAALIANHSPLKAIFNALTKDIPKNTFDALSKAAASHLTRAGYIISNHGVLTHKNDVRPSDNPEQ